MLMELLQFLRAYKPAFVLLPALVFCAIARAENTPKTVSFAGVLKDAGGNLVNDTCDLNFKVWDDPTSTDPAHMLWEEDAESVDIEEGVLIKAIGEGSSSVDFDDTLFAEPDRWLEVALTGCTVGPDPSLDRIKVASNPYAFRAETVDGAEAGTVTGTLQVASNTSGSANILMYGEGTGGGGAIWIRNNNLYKTIRLDGDDDDGGGEIDMENDQNKVTVLIDADDGDDAARVELRNSEERVTVLLDASASTGHADDGVVQLYDKDGHSAFRLHSDELNDAPYFRMYASDAQDVTRQTVEIAARASSADASGGRMSLRRMQQSGGLAMETLKLNAAYDDNQEASGGSIEWLDGNGESRIRAYVDYLGITGQPYERIEVGQSTGDRAYVAASGFFANNGSQNTVRLIGSTDGSLELKSSDGTSTIELDSDHANSGFSRIIVDELELRGGCDLTEKFNVRDDGTDVAPGMLVSIDPATPGQLMLSNRAYDSRVAGIISGAGGIRPGMTMSQPGTMTDGKHPVALTGRVYCWADVSTGAIKPGDLLTTSSFPGYAMKVTDPARAQGAVIGKAMSALDEGTGLVLVLVNLQ